MPEKIEIERDELIERLKISHQTVMAELQDEMNARLGFQHELSQSLFRSLVLINGGAVIGLLTFIGNSMANIEPVAMKEAFWAFGGSLTMVFFAYLFSYYSQAFFMNGTAFAARRLNDGFINGVPDPKWELSEESQRRNGTWAFRAASILLLISLWAFIHGANSALNSITL